MSSPTQFRHYLIAQDAEGSNIEVIRSSEQVAVLAFDSRRMCFVHCHVMLEPVKDPVGFDLRGRQMADSGHPLLARLVDYGEDEGSSYYITDHVDGESLTDYLARLDRLPVWMAMKLSLLSLHAVQAALERGDYLPLAPLESLRILQTGPLQLSVMLADFRLLEDAAKASRKGASPPPSFDKQSQFLRVFFEEHLEGLAMSDGTTLSASDFGEILSKVLASANAPSAGSIPALTRAIETIMPSVMTSELAASFKPKPILADCLATFQEVARSVVQAVRIQSQKLDMAQPYAMRGTLMKTGQNVSVEQVAPRHLAGLRPSEAVRQVQALPKSGKFPNLVPVLFLEENEGIECVAETAVEGVSLSELLQARGTLQPQEVYLVLAGLDTALGQTEKAGIGTRRIRLEDVFLFTGLGRDHPSDNELLQTRLNEWPGFSIVLRAHPCLHSMSCRGSDPGLLLPVEVRARPDVELFWNGGWMAALGCYLVGMPEGRVPKKGLFDTRYDALGRMLQDEVEMARKGTPTARAAFLSRYAARLQQLDLSQVESGLWQELSGAGSAQGTAQELTARATSATIVAAPAATAAEPVVKRSSKLRPISAVAPGTAAMGAFAPSAVTPSENPEIGFAELLISNPADEEPPALELGVPDAAHEAAADELESSWSSLHEEKSTALKALLVLGGSLALGAVLAQISGRAIWQSRDVVPKAIPAEQTSSTNDDKPSAKEEAKSSKAVPKAKPMTLPPPQRPALADLDVDAASRRPSKPGTPPSLTDTKLVKPASTPGATPAPPSPPVPKPLKPNSKFGALRVKGGRLDASVRSEVDKAAQNGDIDAMMLMGLASLKGDLGTVDERAAFKFFDWSAKANDIEGKRWLGACYLQGWGTEANPTRAVELLTETAAAGDLESKNLLGVCYARGLGVVRDDSQAFILFTEAHDAGVVAACGNLGAMYLRGQGTIPNAEKAVALFFEGAKKGHSESMLLYAQALEYGTGTHADANEARNWYQQAARLGNAEAASWCQQKGFTY